MCDFTEMTIEEMLNPEGFKCECGKTHYIDLKYIKIERGAVKYTPDAVKALGCRYPFIVCDENTYEAAGKAVTEVLKEAGISYKLYVFPTKERLNPAEWELGSIMLHYDSKCDLILAVGGGVINDLCKVSASMAHVPSMLVITAPSMDGIVSNSGAMEVNHVKTTVYTPAPYAVICDTDIMSKAPFRMLQAGVGDMAAKLISICEWRIAALITGEYYCEKVADIMRSAWKKIYESIDGIVLRDPDSIAKVTEGLVLAGIAMAFAEVSRPASGIEHMFSHIWEMMALERGGTYDLHGIQVGVGTVISLKLYDEVKKFTPEKAHMEARVAAFDKEEWAKMLRRVFGKTADELFAIEEKLQKNAPENRLSQGQKVIDNWDKIQKIIAEEIPESSVVIDAFKKLDFPMTAAEIGISRQDEIDAFVTAKDIRKRYMLSTLLWDTGYTEEFTDKLREIIEDGR